MTTLFRIMLNCLFKSVYKSRGVFNGTHIFHITPLLQRVAIWHGQCSRLDGPSASKKQLTYVAGAYFNSLEPFALLMALLATQVLCWKDIVCRCALGYALIYHVNFRGPSIFLMKV